MLINVNMAILSGVIWGFVTMTIVIFIAEKISSY
jgi:hypothetical protein